MQARFVVLLVALTAAAAAAHVEAGGAPQIVVVRDSLALPAGCSPRETAHTVIDLLDAIDRGDARAIARRFPATDGRPPAFQWFTGPEGQVLQRAGLVTHLLSFSQQGIRYRLRKLDVGGSPKRSYVGFTLVLERTAEGVTRAVRGKGALDCTRGRFFVWSTGFSDSGRTCGGVEAEGVVVACSRTGRRPTAQEVAPTFVSTRTPLRLPAGCGMGRVRVRVLRALRAFNQGDGTEFAREFTGRASFQPYNSNVAPLRGRREIGRFVSRRYATRDGWTGTALDPPTGAAGLPAVAVFGLGLTVLRDDVALARKGAKIVVDCPSGLFRRWVGPGLALPR